MRDKRAATLAASRNDMKTGSAAGQAQTPATCTSDVSYILGSVYQVCVLPPPPPLLPPPPPPPPPATPPPHPPHPPPHPPHPPPPLHTGCPQPRQNHQYHVSFCYTSCMFLEKFKKKLLPTCSQPGPNPRNCRPTWCKRVVAARCRSFGSSGKLAKPCVVPSI